MMFQIDLLPAGHGDCLWIEYGTGDEVHRVLIDGGTAQTYPTLRERLLALPRQARCFELVVVTHVDADHIEGIIPLLADRSLGLKVQEVWFNGWPHVAPHASDRLGPVHGEMLSALIDKKKLAWNQAFSGEAVATDTVDASEKPIKLAGGLRIQLLSPGRPALDKMRKVWKREVQKAGLEPGNPRQALERLAQTRKLLPADGLGPARPNPQTLAKTPCKADRSVANGSSIAFIASYQENESRQETTCLFSGDAHPDTLVSALKRLAEERGVSQIKLDAFKVSHHGGRSNLSNELLDCVNCSNFIISTDGNYFGHPHLESISRIITHSRQKVDLFFNYHSDYNCLWQDRSWIRKYNYQAHYPPAKGAGIQVRL